MRRILFSSVQEYSERMAGNGYVSDEGLVRAAQGGDVESFEALVTRYERALYRFSYRFARDQSTAEDIVQDSFIKAWSRLRQCKNGDSFRAWLFSICRNTALDALKRKKDIPFSAFEAKDGGNSIFDSFADARQNAAELLERAYNSATAEGLLSQLPLFYREVLLLRYGEGLTFKEIGRALGRPLDTVKSQHQRALSVMRSRALHAPKKQRQSSL